MEIIVHDVNMFLIIWQIKLRMDFRGRPGQHSPFCQKKSLTTKPKREYNIDMQSPKDIKNGPQNIKFGPCFLAIAYKAEGCTNPDPCYGRSGFSFFCRASKHKEVCHATAGESPAINFAHPASQSTSAGDLETGDKVVDRQHRKTTYGTTNEPVGFDSLKRGLAYAGMGNQSPYSTVGRSIASHHLWCGAIFIGGQHEL